MTDIEPTLNDDGVMDFIASGYIVLEGLIEDDFNRYCLDQPRSCRPVHGRCSTETSTT